MKREGRPIVGPCAVTELRSTVGLTRLEPKGNEVMTPPDLSPQSVPHDGDVLAGWDEVAPKPERRRMKADLTVGRFGGQKAALPGFVAVVSGALAGGLVGALFTRQSRSIGAALGTLAGVVAAMAGVHLRDHRREDA